MWHGRAVAAVILPWALALAGCGRVPEKDQVDTLDQELAGPVTNARDPALTGALADQIMVDPGLTAKANHDALRPPPRPYTGGTPPETIAATAQPSSGAESERLASTPGPKDDCPGCKAARGAVTLGQLAQRQAEARKTPGFAGACLKALSYSAGWVQRLPADLPLPPEARVIEAAGAADHGCTVRIVSFTTTTPSARVLDWYYTRATHAGYSAEHRADGDTHELGGSRARDGGSFVVFATARADGGTDVDLIADKGR